MSPISRRTWVCYIRKLVCCYALSGYIGLTIVVSVQRGPTCWGTRTLRSTYLTQHFTIRSACQSLQSLRTIDKSNTSAQNGRHATSQPAGLPKRTSSSRRRSRSKSILKTQEMRVIINEIKIVQDSIGSGKTVGKGTRNKASVWSLLLG